MRLLDLFCGAGGAAMGYHRAGFTEIVGVDIKPQPRYPFAFVQGDALEYVREHGREFDAIHASPPCQAYARGLSNCWNRKDSYPDLLPDTREELDAGARPWVIENVPGAPMRSDLILCGTMFGLGWGNRSLHRHRWFEAGNWALPPWAPASCNHAQRAVGVFGHSRGNARWGGGSAADQMRSMGIDWMKHEELTQAIPPAYTEFIGRQLLQALTPSPAS